jgi:hypothetical protein
MHTCVVIIVAMPFWSLFLRLLSSSFSSSSSSSMDDVGHLGVVSRVVVVVVCPEVVVVDRERPLFSSFFFFAGTMSFIGAVCSTTTRSIIIVPMVYVVLQQIEHKVVVSKPAVRCKPDLGTGVVVVFFVTQSGTKGRTNTCELPQAAVVKASHHDTSPHRLN